ncbi:hypothetical protein [Poseidonocella sp. HB161398]|uniref:hypothetical protein n=1 Tax=Poseidonocella sp. HB161398 TaxID=2320855 RepID=UPI0011089704|nr:hypothetical protein [Poseidonocella sp. HB161398]
MANAQATAPVTLKETASALLSRTKATREAAEARLASYTGKKRTWERLREAHAAGDRETIASIAENGLKSAIVHLASEGKLRGQQADAPAKPAPKRTAAKAKPAAAKKPAGGFATTRRKPQAGGALDDQFGDLAAMFVQVTSVLEHLGDRIAKLEGQPAPKRARK